MVNKFLHYLLFILGIVFMIFPYRFKYFYALMFISFGLSLFSSYFIKRIGLGEKQYLLVLIIIWLNVVGELYFYFAFLYYDKLLHFVVPMILTFIYLDYLGIKKTKPDFFSFFTVLGFLGFFEIFEWFISKFIGFPMVGVFDASGNTIMNVLTDTMVDLIMGCLGILVFLIYNQYFKKQFT